jgi:LmbE family N-acetylglucosaminyl deacetylase
MPRRLVLVLLLLSLSVSGRHELTAQVRPIYDRGAAGLTQVLQRLTTTASVLHIGAHPDDEDSAFMARAARGDHARTAYLSLNRGEGGQNIIGPELFEALGVIRTEELLQARRLDGGEQYFTRAFDFGFSKTRAETATKWDEEAVLGDVVRVIRTFKPLVIYSRFSGTAADGHGHHQMAGYLAPVAYRAAGDPARVPVRGDAQFAGPWQPRKLYSGGRGGGTGPVLQLQTGAWDPVIGRTYAAIAAEGRSQHKSQDMGTIEPLGPSTTALRLVDARVQTPATEGSIFDGIDVSVPGLGRLAGLPADALAAELTAIDGAGRRALQEYRATNPATIIPALAEGLRATRAARRTLVTLPAPQQARTDADFLLARKEEEFADALTRAAGIVLDPLSDRETVEPGGALDVTVRLFAPQSPVVSIGVLALEARAGWQVAPATDAAEGPAFRRETPAKSARYRVGIPADAPPTQPFFLRAPRTGAMYSIDPDADPTRPFEPPALHAIATLTVGGETVTMRQPVTYRYADSVRGELRREPNVVPSLGVGFESNLVVIPTARRAAAHRVEVRVSNLAREAVRGELSLVLPAGWRSTPAVAPFVMTATDATATAAFSVRASAGTAPGRYAITARATAAGASSASFARDMQLISYPHIQTHRLYTDAVAAAPLIDLAVAPVRVGYIMGSGDQVPDALRRMNVSVTMLDDRALATGDLSVFDTIVVGIRASEARPAFVSAQARLRTFMERGGTLIVQYQQGEYTTRNLAPYPAQIAGNSRVTDEEAPVTILAPAHPAFRYPNRIGAADFAGWVQERNLYAFTSFDARYVPLLASADPGEMPQRGGQVYARVGRGHYVYTAYAWFRQLPAGVPGAYRMFANLISLSKAPAPAGSPAPGGAARTGGAPVEAEDRTRPSR